MHFESLAFPVFVGAKHISGNDLTQRRAHSPPRDYTRMLDPCTVGSVLNVAVINCRLFLYRTALLVKYCSELPSCLRWFS